MIFFKIACLINTYMLIWSDFEFVIHLACIIKPRILDIIWPCLLILKIMTWLFSGILFTCALVVSFAARARSARAANDTTRAQINNIPSKSHVIPLFTSCSWSNYRNKHVFPCYSVDTLLVTARSCWRNAEIDCSSGLSLAVCKAFSDCLSLNVLVFLKHWAFDCK